MIQLPDSLHRKVRILFIGDMMLVGELCQRLGAAPAACHSLQAHRLQRGRGGAAGRARRRARHQLPPR